MGSRAAGGVLLALAVTASLITSRAANPPTSDGRPTVEPPAPLPAVQSCLVDPPPKQAWKSSGQLVVVPHHLFVSCDQPHAAEVFYTYDFIDSLAGNPSQRQALCIEPGGDADAYLGITPAATARDTWRPELSYQVTVVGPDEQQLAAGQSWSACVLSLSDPAADPLTRTLRGAVSTGIPPALGRCVTGDTSDRAADIPVPCSLGHTTEVFGVLSGQPPAGVTTESLLPSCRELVTDATLRTITPTDPDLAVAVVMVAFSDRGTETVSAAPADRATNTSCVVHVPPGRALDETLRDISDAPIPWAS